MATAPAAVGDTLGSYIRALRPHFSPGLFSPEAIARLQNLADALPPSRNAGFECRLGGGFSQVDLLAAYAPEWIGLEELRRAARERSWRPLSDFLAAWNAPGTSSIANVNVIWLEFDLLGEEAVPSPSVFVRVVRPPDAGEDYWRRVLDDALGPLHKEGLESGARSALQRALVALPPTARGVYLGLMLSRGAPLAVRINLAGVDASALSAYARAHLPSTSWAGDLSAFQRRLADLAGRVDWVTLNLDVGKTETPRIGLECRIDESVEGRTRWNAFLAHLVDEELCTEQEKEDVVAWPGAEACRPGGDGPSGPEAMAAFLGTAPFVIARSINHIKIDIDACGQERAKAYLWFGPRWPERQVLTQTD